MSKPIAVVVDGSNHLRLQQQYAKLPQEGVVVAVEQRTTRAGRSVLLRPEQVEELRDALTAWLSALPGTKGGDAA